MQHSTQQPDQDIAQLNQQVLKGGGLHQTGASSSSSNALHIPPCQDDTHRYNRHKNIISSSGVQMRQYSAWNIRAAGLPHESRGLTWGSAGGSSLLRTAMGDDLRTRASKGTCLRSYIRSTAWSRLSLSLTSGLACCRLLLLGRLDASPDAWLLLRCTSACQQPLNHASFWKMPSLTVCIMTAPR